MKRLSVHVRGIVQGVGFRPFVAREAAAHGLSGWVRNDDAGVEIEVQGHGGALETFVAALGSSRPPGASVEAIRVADLPLADGESGFVIASSRAVVVGPMTRSVPLR